MFTNTLRRTLCGLWGVLVLFGAGNAFAGYMDTLNLREGVTDISHKVFNLHMLIFWICVVACVLGYQASGERCSEIRAHARGHSQCCCGRCRPFSTVTTSAFTETTSRIWLRAKHT